MEVRYPTDAEEREDLRHEERGKILLFIRGHYSHDAAVTPEELLDLRSEIDKFLFLRLAHQLFGEQT